MTAPNTLHIREFYSSAANSRMPEVHQFLDTYGDEYIDAPNEAGYTALMGAISGNWPSAVEALLARGADVNARHPENGHTPLTGALMHNRWMWPAKGQEEKEQASSLSIIKMLLAAGADLQAVDNNGHGAESFIANQFSVASARYAVSAALELANPRGLAVKTEVELPQALKLRFARGWKNAP